MDIDVAGVKQAVSTGTLPDAEQIKQLLADTYDRYRDYTAGDVADYIPVLAEADPQLFSICVAGTTGTTHSIGDQDVEFTIQSISKAFVYALVCSELGHEKVHQRVGVNNTGLPFNSVMAVELNDGHPMNPMVNAGALATTALICGDNPEQQWQRIHAGLSAFAGRDLELDQEVYRSEAGANTRNAALATLIKSYGGITSDPAEVVDVYTKQCSLLVTTRDLAIMGATLADGGVNPITGKRVVSAQVCRDALAVMATSGMYERSGDWLFEIGLPAKSGVSGGIVAIAPGKGAVATFSPPLDSAGNSVRGQRVIARLSRLLGLNVFASAVQVVERG